MPDDTPPQPAPKKRPGRPRKTPVNPPVPVDGIRDKPANDEDIIEMVYCNPSLFKKVFTLMKGYESAEIDILFGKQAVQIAGKDHLGKSNIYVFIDAAMLNYYYCKEPTRLRVKMSVMNQIFSSLEKTHYKVTWLLKEQYRSALYIIVQDHEYEDEEHYEIEVIHPGDGLNNNAKDNDSAYPVKFVMNSKYFKKKITAFSRMSDTITITKLGNEPLQLARVSERAINFNYVYKNNDKIKLQSNIQPDDFLTVTVNLEYIKPFSNANIGDDVCLSVDRLEKLCLTTFLDKVERDGVVKYVAIVKVFIEIKDYGKYKLEEAINGQLDEIVD